ncbi:MAG: DUF4203 domain-containing protein [Chloroflexota bacterium]|nr:DUF4203 domain-containing protein [Chloroflexota bacterium]
MDILAGIVLLVVGLVVTLAGLRVFLFALPIIGFVIGFFIGSIALQSLFGDGFLATVASWIPGVILGIVFAAISYFWWYAGALISAGAVGASIGAGIVHAVSGASDGFVYFLLGAVGFVVFFAGALLLNLPVYIVIVNTALAGSLAAIAGALLLIDQVDRGELGRGATVAFIQEGWIWVLLWVVLAAVGIFAQLSARDSVALPEERWSPATTA